MNKQEYTEKRTLLEDRQRLFDRIVRVGYVPDKDMRADIVRIREELNHRINKLRDELMECDFQ